MAVKIKRLIFVLVFLVFLTGGYFYFKPGSPTDESVARLQDEGNRLRLQEKYTQAEVCFRKSIKQADELYGENNIAAATAYAGLGTLFLQKKDYAKAADNLLLASDIYECSAGNALFPEKLFSLKLSAANVLEEIKDYKRADEAYDFVETYLDELQPEIQFKYYFYRGRGYFNRQEFKQASVLLQKGYDSQKDISSVQKAEICEELGHSYLRLDQYKKAQTYYQKLLVISQQKYGEDSPETVVFYILLANALVLDKKYSEASHNFRKVINILEHSNLFKEYLAYAYFALGKTVVKEDKKSAVEYWKKAYAIQNQMSSSEYVSLKDLEKLIEKYDK